MELEERIQRLEDMYNQLQLEIRALQTRCQPYRPKHVGPYYQPYYYDPAWDMPPKVWCNCK